MVYKNNSSKFTFLGFVAFGLPALAVFLTFISSGELLYRLEHASPIYKDGALSFSEQIWRSINEANVFMQSPQFRALALILAVGVFAYFLIITPVALAAISRIASAAAEGKNVSVSGALSEAARKTGKLIDPAFLMLALLNTGLLGLIAKQASITSDQLLFLPLFLLMGFAALLGYFMIYGLLGSFALRSLPAKMGADIKNTKLHAGLNVATAAIYGAIFGLAQIAILLPKVLGIAGWVIYAIFMIILLTLIMPRLIVKSTLAATVESAH